MRGGHMIAQRSCARICAWSHQELGAEGHVHSKISECLSPKPFSRGSQEEQSADFSPIDGGKMETRRAESTDGKKERKREGKKEMTE